MSRGKYGGITLIKICAFADEADKTVKGQIEALKRNGLSLIELRVVDRKNVSEITEEEAMAFAEQFKAAGITVWSIGSPLGKVSIEEDIEEYLKVVRHVCKLAKIFGTDKIRMFSFKEVHEKEDLVFEYLRRMVEVATEEGVQLYHENEKGIYGDIPERILKIMENVDGLKYVYDPANFLRGGLSADDTIAALYDKTSYFHVKDVILAKNEQVPAGHGDGKIDELVARVPADVERVFTIEPHLKVVAPDDAEKIAALEAENKRYFTDAHVAFDTAVNAFKQVLASVGYKEENGCYIK